MAAAALDPRWLFVSRSLYMELLFDGELSVAVSAAALRKFLDVVVLRSRDEVAEADFARLYAQWRSLVHRPPRAGADGGPAPAPAALVAAVTAGSVTETQFRRILLSVGASATDLDIFLGLLINEANRMVLAAGFFPGSDRGASSGARLPFPASSATGPVDGAWLAAAEALFFVLDEDGSGHMSLDELGLFGSAVIACGGLAPERLGGVVARCLDAMNCAGGLVPGVVTLRGFKLFLFTEAFGAAAIGAIADQARAEKARRHAMLSRPFDKPSGRLWPTAVEHSTGNHRQYDVLATCLRGHGALPMEVWLAFEGARCRTTAFLAAGRVSAGPDSLPIDARALDDMQAAAIWKGFTEQPGLSDPPASLEALMKDARVQMIITALATWRQMETAVSAVAILPSASVGSSPGKMPPDRTKAEEEPTLSAGGVDLLRSPWSAEAMRALIEGAQWVEVTPGVGLDSAQLMASCDSTPLVPSPGQGLAHRGSKQQNSQPVSAAARVAPQATHDVSPVSAGPATNGGGMNAGGRPGRYRVASPFSDLASEVSGDGGVDSSVMVDDGFDDEDFVGELDSGAARRAKGLRRALRSMETPASVPTVTRALQAQEDLRLKQIIADGHS